MKKSTNFILTIMAIMALTACQKKPSADFTMSKNTAEVGESVVFTSISTNAYTLMWNFGDGNLSTFGTTTHTYDTPGLYTVKLTVYSKNGKKSDEVSKIISIIQPVLAEMMVPANGNNTYTTCMGILYDHGGANGNYSNDCDGYTILYPATPQKKIRVNGTLNVESSWDNLEIINGNSPGNQVLWTGSGNTTIPYITSTASNGALLIRFYSDESVTNEGFVINVSCVD